MNKVLIIDDEFGPRESMRFLLKDKYDVFCAKSVDEGIAALKENPPDIIISDIKMPGKTGIEGLQEIRKIDQDVSVIMLTGYGSLETAQQAIRLGANDYVKKPFDTTEMRNIVARYVAKTCAIRNKNAAASDLEILKKELQETIDKKERLADLGQASSEFVHDISNPIMVLSGYVELMIEEMNNAENNNSTVDMLDFIENIQQSSARCKELLKSWKSFGQKSNTNNETIDITSIIKEVADAARPATNAINARIEINADNNPQTIKGNSTQLFRALQNLIGNAVQALPPQNGIVRIKCTADNNSLIIQISDNGSGIHEDKLKNIFKPYFTTKKLSGGTGLGLYITQKIIKEHNGDIILENNPDGGATATLTLPIADCSNAEQNSSGNEYIYNNNQNNTSPLITDMIEPLKESNFFNNNALHIITENIRQMSPVH
jgi:signal transduction histidine kinase